jgi:hypothetical protein
MYLSPIHEITKSIYVLRRLSFFFFESGIFIVVAGLRPMVRHLQQEKGEQRKNKVATRRRRCTIETKTTERGYKDNEEKRLYLTEPDESERED